jgi:hypothetical protein
MKKIYTILFLLALLGWSMCATYAQKTYIITGSGTQFNVTENSVPIGSPNLTIQNAIGAIETNAAGEDCTIQFGDDIETLDIGTAGIVFDSWVATDWGVITLTGKLTSSNPYPVSLKGFVSLDCRADITGTASQVVLFGNSTGKLTISAGKILLTSDDGYAVLKENKGEVFIMGGTIEATGSKGKAIGYIPPASGAGIMRFDGNAVIRSNNEVAVPFSTSEAGTIVLSGTSSDPGTRLYFNSGTIENTAPTGVAVSNNSNHIVLLAGGTIISAGGAVGNFLGGTVIINGGTISATVAGVGNFASGKLWINGGTISSETFFAVGNLLAGTVIIEGGLLLAKEGYAINNFTTGTVTVTGGIGFAYGTTPADVFNGTIDLPTPNDAVLVAWDKDASAMNYDEGTDTDIVNIPNGTAVWGNNEGIGGIVVNYNDITKGFIPIEGVTVLGINTIENYNVQIYPNPTTGELRIETGDMRYEMYDVYGRMIVIPNEAQRNDESITINISRFPSGIYFLKIETEKGVVTKKIIKI